MLLQLASIEKDVKTRRVNHDLLRSLAMELPRLIRNWQSACACEHESPANEICLAFVAGGCSVLSVCPYAGLDCLRMMIMCLNLADVRCLAHLQSEQNGQPPWQNRNTVYCTSQV